MKREVVIPEEVVADINLKDTTYQALRETISSLVEAHALDEDTSFVSSPVFSALQNKMTMALKEFNEAKNKLQEDYIPKDIPGKNWDLNYATNIMTITY